MAKLINGNGNPAIYAAEDADLIASLAGNVTCISNVGNKYAATEEDATTIRLDDGVIITKEGRRIQLEAGESDTFYIPTGTSGQTNYYIIGYKLVQNADSTQVAEQFVQKMNSSSETITEDTFRNGATEVYVSLYRVTQVGFTIDSISGLLPELLDNASIKDNIDQINSDLNDTELIHTFTNTDITTNNYIGEITGSIVRRGKRIIVNARIVGNDNLTSTITQLTNSINIGGTAIHVGTPIIPAGFQAFRETSLSLYINAPAFGIQLSADGQRIYLVGIPGPLGNGTAYAGTAIFELE